MDWRLRQQRRPAINEPWNAHELTFTCYHRYPFLRAERTCAWLAESLEDARKILDFALWAYVFMPDHVHLVVFPRQMNYDISEIRKTIKGPVGREAVKFIETHSPDWLPAITVKRGERTERRFWEAGGGFDRNVTDADALFAMVEYIHLNPVRKGLTAHATDWKWSSAGWFAGEGKNSLKPDPIDVSLLDAKPYLRGRG